MIRAFFALPLEQPAEQQLARYSRSLQTQLSRQPMRWVIPENYHLTLAFLGNINEADVDKLAVIAEQVALAHRPAELSFCRLTWLPSPHRPKVLVVEPEPQATLMQLQADLIQQLRAKGFAIDNKRFRPHISLARVKGRLAVAALEDSSLHICSPMDEVVLLESRLTPQGPVYTPRFAVPLV